MSVEALSSNASFMFSPKITEHNIRKCTFQQICDSQVRTPLKYHQSLTWISIYYYYIVSFALTCVYTVKACIVRMEMRKQCHQVISLLSFSNKLYLILNIRMFLVALYHTLITWPLASKWTLSYATSQCVGILLTFFINPVMWPFDVWKYTWRQMLRRVQRKKTLGLGWVATTIHHNFE